MRPDFFIVGAPKCGTTALGTYLGQHPDVFMSTPKEPNYFGADLHRTKPRITLGTYFSYFERAAGQQRVGEASTCYLCSKTAASEIREFNPDARIIIMLRDPVDMMYSFHSQQLYQGGEHVDDFEAALSDEERRRAGVGIPVNAGVRESLLYRNVARFSEQVERYLDIFGRSKVHTIIFDDLKTDPLTVYGETLRFLELQTDDRTVFPVVNPNKTARLKALHRFLVEPPLAFRSVARLLMPRPMRERVFSGLRRLNTTHVFRPPMDPELKGRLRAEFTPEVERLGQLLGRDLSHWCKSEGGGRP